MSDRPGRYRRVLAVPGIRPLTVAFLALGTSGTMTPVSLVLFARQATGSFAAASGVLAATTAGGLLIGPFRGRLVDRVGPARAVLRLAVPSAATDLAFILAGAERAGTPALLPLAVLAGAVSVPAGSAVRTVWARALPADDRQAGYALMGVISEVNFILGPLLAGLLIALSSATGAVIGSAVLNAAGGLLFALTRQAREHPTSPPTPGRLPALAGSGIRVVLGAAGGFGATFGLLDVGFPAFARSHHATPVAGVLLSAFAAGSLVGGLLYGRRRWRTSAGRRYPALCALATAGLAPLILEPALGIMAARAALAGVCFAPIGICQVAVIDEVTPAAHRAEAFSWLGTVYGGGLALGAAVAGQLVVGSGVRASLLAALLATAAATVVVSLGARRLRVSIAET